MTANELRQRYLDFFKARGHAILSSASLIPREDPSVLFTTAGMHPLVPYLLGQKHPLGQKLVDVQKCIRTGDIDEVGDRWHLSFFEMLGNWSLGDYFKREAIQWSWEFLTSSSASGGLGLDPARISVTVFEGDADALRDEEAAEIWQSCGVSKDRIYYFGKKDNWWGPAGKIGPCGPDTEMFYDTLRQKCSDECRPGCNCGKYVEIWNDVFMQYEKFEVESGKLEGVKQYGYRPLKQKNVDTGMGLERTLAVLNGKISAFETELFTPIIDTVIRIAGVSAPARDDFFTSNERALRIIADHLRAAVFILGDERGVVPSNVDQGYILRRFIRRSARYGRMIGITKPFMAEVAETIIPMFADVYPELESHRDRVFAELTKEEERFAETLQQGLKELERLLKQSEDISGEDAFILFSTYGFPFEMTEEIVRERRGSAKGGSASGGNVDRAGFEAAFSRHQELSRVGAEKKFAGGLADHSVDTTRLHTASHLLLQAMKTVLAPSVSQRGSNITKERLRFDFSWDAKVTPEQIAAIETIANERVAGDLPVHYEVMTVDEARAVGAIGVFDERYGERVKVYFIGRPGNYFSKEICGGPHVQRTSQIGTVKIIKEEAVAQGIRRIKAIVSGGTELGEGEVAEEGLRDS